MSRKIIQTAAALVPSKPTLQSLRDLAAGCRACDLWKKGTQTVFGEGAANASVMLIGEQPGDKEVLAGYRMNRVSAAFTRSRVTLKSRRAVRGSTRRLR